MIKNIEEIEDFVKSNVDELNWVHTQAMRPIAQKLAELENANKDVVEVAVLFHDVSKTNTALSKHARESARIAKEFLKKLKFNEGFIKRVASCVETHSSPWAWAEKAPMPSSIEEKILFDADMLQQLGPFGIAKHVLKYKDKKFNELTKLGKADLVGVSNLLMTESGKKLGKGKIDYVKDFFESALLGK